MPVGISGPSLVPPRPPRFSRGPAGGAHFIDSVIYAGTVARGYALLVI